MNILNIKDSQFVALFALLVLCASGSYAQASEYVLDWDQVTWLPEGSLIQSFNVGPGTINVEVGGNTAGLNDETGTTSQVVSPSLDDTNTGGLTPSELSLTIATDYVDNSNPEVSVTFNFASYQNGVSNLSFSIFDVDEFATFIDQVTITAVANSVLVDPTTLNTSSFNVATSANTAVGTLGVGAPPDSPLANVGVGFDISGITELTITYRNTTDAPDPGFQWINIHDIHFEATPVPAPGAAILFLSALIGLFSGSRQLVGYPG